MVMEPSVYPDHITVMAQLTTEMLDGQLTVQTALMKT
jgi:hypothetical protein